MDNKSTKILGPVKRIMFIILSGVFLILICFIFLNRLNGVREMEDKHIINVFGKQRMYTQMISKDASQLYAIMQAIDVKYGYREEVEMSSIVRNVQADISLAREEFARVLNFIHSGELKLESYSIHFNIEDINSSVYLKQIDYLWAEFDPAIEVLIKANRIDQEVADAVIFINEHNMELLTLCEKLLEQVLASSLERDQVMEYVAYSLIVALIMIVLLSLYQLQRFLLQPFSQLYKGIADIGLDHYPSKPSFPTKTKVMPIVSEINDMFLKINYLIGLIENINKHDSFTDTLQFINKSFSSFVPYNYIGIALIDEEKKMLRASYGVSDETINGLPEHIMGLSWLIKDTSMEGLLNSGEARIINDLEEHCKGKALNPYNRIILEAGIRASITLPLKVSGEPVGLIFFSSSSKNVYTQEHAKFLSTLANSIAISLNQNIFVNDILYSSVFALAKLAETRDEDTGEHMERMSLYARAIAELLFENDMFEDELDVEFVEDIQRYSPLHDIGKVGILDGILLKPGKLTPEEFEEMKKHTTFGAEVLRSSEKNMERKGKSLFRMGIQIAEGHHEKWDGSGYPYGKREYEIPLCARIVAVADVFDALTSKRPYKKAFSFEESVDIIAEGRGKHFDPIIVDVFLNNIDRIKKLYHAYSPEAIAEAE